MDKNEILDRLFAVYDEHSDGGDGFACYAMVLLIMDLADELGRSEEYLARDRDSSGTRVHNPSFERM